MRAALAALVVALLCASARAQVLPETDAVQEKMRELQQRIPSLLDEAARVAKQPDAQRPTSVPPRATEGGEQEMRALWRAARERAEARTGAAIFVSLSMPQEGLRRLAAEAARAGVPMYLRGLPHGFGGGNTARSLAALKPLTDTGATVQIHPELFRRYGITAVPAFVIWRTEQAECGSALCSADVDKVVGDVSFAYALRELASRGGRTSEIAQRLLVALGDPR